MTQKTGAARRDLIIEREFDAPLALVWRAWTEPEHFVKWWGPKDFTAPHCTMDLKAGGTYLYCMRSPEGVDYWTTGAFLEIDPMKRIVYTDNFADKDGKIVSAKEYGMEGDWSEEMVVTITFEEKAGKTHMTLRHTGLPAGEFTDMTGMGWNESFDKLAASIA